MPNYHITHKLLAAMRDIGEALGALKLLAPESASLALLERDARAVSAHASTSIEGNPLALTDVKRLLKSHKHHIRDTEREILNYNKALINLHEQVMTGCFTLDFQTIQAVQGQVIDGLMESEFDVGRFRQAPVVIRDPRSQNDIIFIPPDAKDVEQLTGQLCDFIRDHWGHVDPILLAGLFHRHLVIIHPFMDGNGRTTRLLTTALLGQAGIDLFQIFSFEAFYNRNITRYFRTVGLQGDFYDLYPRMDDTKWLEYFCDGILDELSRIKKTLETLNTPSHIQHVSITQTHELRLEPHHLIILDHIKAYGTITQRDYAALTSRSLASRKLDFNKLVKQGLIVSKGVGRGTYYILKEA